MPKLRITGLVAATHTPFQADGSLHLTGVQRQAEHLLANGIQFAFIGGTTGECHSLTLDERRQLCVRWMQVTRGTALNVVVHVGGNCLADAKTLAAQAQELGAVAIAAMAPSYFKPRTQELLIACCAEIAAAAPELPFYYYDIPHMTGVALPMGEFLEQAKTRVATLAGLKFTNNDLMQLQCCLRAAAGRLDVLFGFDEMLLPALALGVSGAVGSTYNFAAPLYHRVMKGFAAGDFAAARAAQLCSVALIEIVNRYGFMGATKAMMNMIGVEVGPARLPNATLSAESAAALKADLERAGFFDWIRPVR
jgi:N-acetylneuraminate lyase